MVSNSMQFPSIGALVSYYNIFLATGPLLAAVGIGVAWQWTRKRYRLGPQHILMALAFVFIAYVHWHGVYASVLNAAAFRKISLDHVQALEVKALDGDATRPEILLRIEDRPTFVDGLRLLSTAEAYHPEHEHFVDGYRVRIISVNEDGPASHFLSVFCGTSRIGRSGAPERAAIVVPHRGLSHQGSVNHGGEYESRPFVEWLTVRLRRANPSRVYSSCG